MPGVASADLQTQFFFFLFNHRLKLVDFEYGHLGRCQFLRCLQEKATVYSDTIYSDTAYIDTVYSDAVYSDTI